MLMKTTDVIDEPPRHVTGQYLAKNRLNARDRARLAADIIARRAAIDPSTLTVGQVSKICRANRIYVSEVRFPDRVKRRQQKKFAAFFDAIGADGRAELCRCIGVERIWNALTAAL
ncbi:MAG TPA: hypothetical protein VMS82_16545 [Pseudolabrys sp.]|jgi:hypothetical protein|nr:hypothetical protein [Pseudolabrys sp.]